MAFLLLRLSLITLLVSGAYGTVSYVSCSQEKEQALRAAVDSATSMAVAARDAVFSGTINGAQDVFEAAWKPLMLDNDRLLVGYFLNNVAQARDGVRDIKFFCTEDHIHWYKGRNGRTGFWDEAFISTGNKKEKIAIEVPAHSDLPNSKAGSDYSYATAGYSVNADWDTSMEAHIFIQESEFGQTSKLDLRSYSDINKDGIKSNFAYLGWIRPKLAKTVFHELTHATGGTVLQRIPGQNQPIVVYNVNDGDKVYGYDMCHKARLASRSNARVADCLTFLAQAIYIQPQLTSVKKWYWSTGVVDVNTGAPWVGSPENPNQRDVSHMSFLNGTTWVA